MLELIKEIEACVDNDYLRCALGMALTLPDICSHVEYPNQKDSRKRYVDWCQKHLYKQGHLPSHITDSSGEQIKLRVIEPEMCYKLRCAFLHSGNLDLNQRGKDDFPIFNLKITSTHENGIYISSSMTNQEGVLKEISIDIRLLTRVLCNAAKEYYDNCPSKDYFNYYRISVIDIEREYGE